MSNRRKKREKAYHFSGPSGIQGLLWKHCRDWFAGKHSWSTLLSTKLRLKSWGWEILMFWRPWMPQGVMERTKPSKRPLVCKNLTTKILIISYSVGLLPAPWLPIQSAVWNTTFFCLAVITMLHPSGAVLLCSVRWHWDLPNGWRLDRGLRKSRGKMINIADLGQ